MTGVEIRSAAPRLGESRVQITGAPLRRMPLPTDEEYERLLDLVLTRWPELRPRSDQTFGAQFYFAFLRLQHLGRRDRLDMERSPSWWADDARNWLREHQLGGRVLVSAAAFTAAAIADGVGHTAPDNFPCDMSFALQFGGGGRASSHGWRQILATGSLPKPMSLPYPIEVRSPAQIQLAVGWRRR
jgi:hypothetical protein